MADATPVMLWFAGPDARRFKWAVEAIFKVKVLAVRTSIAKGKMRRIGKNSGMRSNWKKAIVTLKEGDAIALFEGK